MKIDAHYYALLAFSRAVGFKKEAAHTIAYASQFVDDAKINQITLTDLPKGIDAERINGVTSFFNMATAHQYFQINTFNYSAMINNTAAFHFVPGCRGESFAKKLRCREESPIIKDILEDVKREANLIKLGIVFHAYADSFTHQGFSGLVSKVNNIKDCRPEVIVFGKWEFIYCILYFLLAQFPRFKERLERMFKSFKPAYGHAQALSFPDIPYLNWQYRYDYSSKFANEYKLTTVNNRKRFKRAFKKIKQHLVNYLQQHPEYKEENFVFDDYERLFTVLLKKRRLSKRISNWQDTLINLNLFSPRDKGIINYDEELWLKEAFVNFESSKFNNREVTEVRMRNDFKDSNWYKFYLGVKWYKEKFYDYLEKYSVEIPK